MTHCLRLTGFWFLFMLMAFGVKAQDKERDAHPQDAIQAVERAFDTHPIVAIAENHWLRQAGDFYISLVKDPHFAEKANDIVIEFGSRRSQAVVNRYISGENVSQEELQHVWQDSTKVMSWESPIYAELLAAVRQVNQTLDAKRRLRVLAGDSPIDWSKVHTNEEWSAFQPNDNSFSWVINNEVLKKHRKALVILGSNHLSKGANAWGEPDTTTLVEDQYPGSVFVILMYSGNIPTTPADEQRMADWKKPSIMATKDNWIGTIKVGGRNISDLADAFLYLGPKDSIVQANPDWHQMNADYLKEVARRYQLVYGCEFDAKLLGTGRRPCQ